MLPIYKNMFNLANSLNKASLLLSENVFDGKKDGDFIAPSVLCSTFCLELLLKALLLIKIEDAFTKDDLENKGVRINVHKYSEIFDKIDDDVKNEIIKNYNTKNNEHIEVKDFRNKLIEVGDDNFVEWRYVYEKGITRNLDSVLESKLIDALGETAVKLIKNKRENT